MTVTTSSPDPALGQPVIAHDWIRPRDGADRHQQGQAGDVRVHAGFVESGFIILAGSQVANQTLCTVFSYLASPGYSRCNPQ